MNPLTIPTVRPLKKSFVIIGLIFLFIGFAIEYGVPLPNFQKMAGKGKRKVKDKFARKGIPKKKTGPGTIVAAPKVTGGEVVPPKAPEKETSTEITPPPKPPE